MSDVALKAGLGWLKVAAGATILGSLLATTGCAGFFVCQKASCPTSGTGTTGSGDYVYVSNSTAGTGSISAYQIATGSLTAITGSPFSLGYVPVAMAVSPNDEYLYVASQQTGSTGTGLYVYPISSTGALNNGTELVTSTEIDSMAISPDGYFLFTVGPNTLGVETLSEYALNTSTGAIIGSGATTTPLPSGTNCALTSASPVSQSCTVAVSPSQTNMYVAVAAGLSGTLVYPYISSTTGGLQLSSGGGYTGYIGPYTSSSGDYSLGFDGSGYMYVSNTADLISYSGLSNSTPTQGTIFSNYALGATPRSVTLSTGYNYLYTADEGTNTITAFGLSGGVPTQLSGSPVLGPTGVSALAVERSGAYLLAAGYNNTNGLQMFAITSSGLTALTSEGTGASTSVPVVMALTH